MSNRGDARVGRAQNVVRVRRCRVDEGFLLAFAFGGAAFRALAAVLVVLAFFRLFARLGGLGQVRRFFPRRFGLREEVVVVVGVPAHASSREVVG